MVSAGLVVLPLVPIQTKWRRVLAGNSTAKRDCWQPNLQEPRGVPLIARFRVVVPLTARFHVVVPLTARFHALVPLIVSLHVHFHVLIRALVLVLALFRDNDSAHSGSVRANQLYQLFVLTETEEAGLGNVNRSGWEFRLEDDSGARRGALAG